MTSSQQPFPPIVPVTALDEERLPEERDRAEDVEDATPVGEADRDADIVNSGADGDEA